MRFTCEKSLLLQGLNIAGRTVAQKSALSAIEGILCQAGSGITLTGYNMETAITYQIAADVSDEGECVFPKLFSDIIRRLPEGPVTVVVDEQYHVSIRSGYSSFTISAESADEYPDLPGCQQRPPHPHSSERTQRAYLRHHLRRGGQSGTPHPQRREVRGHQ